MSAETTVAEHVRRISGGPDFIVIGAQKAGSSYVQDALRAHPGVYMPSGETPFFEEVGATDNPAELLRLVAGRRPGQLAGIKRPDYLASPGCAERVHSLLPGARLLAVLRDPVERAVAAYYHYMLHGFVPVRPADEGFAALLARGEIVGHPRSAEILEYGFYAKHLDAYYARFDASQVCVVVYDALRDHPQATLARIFAFLDLDPMMPSVARANPTIYSLSAIRVVRAAARTGMPGAVGGLQRVFARTGIRRTPLPDALVARLRSLYADDIRRLSEHGLEVGAWA